MAEQGNLPNNPDSLRARLYQMEAKISALNNKLIAVNRSIEIEIEEEERILNLDPSSPTFIKYHSNLTELRNQKIALEQQFNGFLRMHTIGMAKLNGQNVSELEIAEIIEDLRLARDEYRENTLKKHQQFAVLNISRNFGDKNYFKKGAIIATVGISVALFFHLYNHNKPRFDTLVKQNMEQLLKEYSPQIDVKIGGVPKWTLPSIDANGKIQTRPGAIVMAISLAEGTGSVDNSGLWEPNEAYYGHGDPNGHVLNFGSFSYQFYQISPDRLTSEERHNYNSFISSSNAAGISDTRYAPADPSQLQTLRNLAKKHSIPEICDKQAMVSLKFKEREARIIQGTKKHDMEPEFELILGGLDAANQGNGDKGILDDYVTHYKELQNVKSQIKKDPGSSESKKVLNQFIGSDLQTMPAHFYRNPKDNLAITPDTVINDPALGLAIVATLSFYDKGAWKGNGYDILARDERKGTRGVHVAFGDFYRRSKIRTDALKINGINPSSPINSQIKIADNSAESVKKLSPEELEAKKRDIDMRALQQLTTEQLSTAAQRLQDGDVKALAQQFGVNEVNQEIAGALKVKKKDAAVLQKTLEDVQKFAKQNFGIEGVPIDLTDLASPEESEGQLKESSTQSPFKSDKIAGLSPDQIQQKVKNNQLTAYDLKDLPPGVVSPSEMKAVQINEGVMKPNDPGNFRKDASGNPRWHNGVDAISQPGGKNVISTVNGTVIQAVEGIEAGSNGEGNIGWVVIQGFDGNLYFYLHNTHVHVKKGQKVWMGTDLAEMGSSGTTSTGAHVHYAAILTKFGSPGSMIKSAKSSLNLVNEGHNYFSPTMSLELVEAYGRILVSANRNDLIDKSTLLNSEGTCDPVLLAQTLKMNCGQLQTAQVLMHAKMREAGANSRVIEGAKTEVKSETSSTLAKQNMEVIDDQFNSLSKTPDVKLLAGTNLNYVNQGINYNNQLTVNKRELGHDNHCGAAAVVMVERWFEITKEDPQQLSSRVSQVFEKTKDTRGNIVDPYGNPNNPRNKELINSAIKMREYLNKEGFETSDMDWNFDAIKKQIDTNKPVILFYERKNSVFISDHIVLVVGYKQTKKEKYLIVHDPQFNNNTYGKTSALFNLNGAFSVYNFDSLTKNKGSFSVSR